MPSIMPFLSIRALKLKRVAIASLMDVASKLYNRKMNTRPMAVSSTGELNISVLFWLKRVGLSALDNNDTI